MSTLINGTEDLVGQNLTPAAAYAIVNTGFQKLAQMSLYNQVCRFESTVHNNDISDPDAIPYQRLVAQVQVIVKGHVPTGASLTVQLLIAGAAQTPTISVAASGTYALSPFYPGTSLMIPANTICSAQIVTASAATDVVVKILAWLVIP